ncbi:MAG: hypothetical protein HYY52_03635 [Candidatus Melainabacteria bacterium]|nr:hypothetical protein [Candidatus Melainabacteria bacterium]
MSIEGKGKYLGKKRVELDQELNLPPNTEFFFIIEDIRSPKKNEPLENCFAGLVDENIDLENEIRTIRKEVQKDLEEKIENWNT